MTFRATAARAATGRSKALSYAALPLCSVIFAGFNATIAKPDGR